MYKLMVVLGLLILTLVTVGLSACSSPGDSGVDLANVKGNVVRMESTAFSPTVITIKKGEDVKLVNDAGVPHIIENGTWKDGTARPAIEKGAPTVSLNSSGTGVSSIGPFNTAGTFQLYCTVHPDMNLTVVVK